ncbi:hypothetical protein [Aggregatilinea lenta]|uniref:hypothetical protein n=1 Tax=Aggregatilinea lenta TaxID=913108 RepID=UPI000E5AD763|nr:hypothetical protein [Aggregatilinea lenta]
MDEKRLKHVLTQRAEQEIPDSMDIRSKVHDRLGVPAPARTPFVARLNLKWAAALVVVLAASTGAVYALMQTLLQPDPGLRTVQAENQIVQLGQMQSLPVDDPLTRLDVTLDYAYADANRIAVGYHVTGSAAAGTGVEVYSNQQLADAQGRAYPWLPTSGQQTTQKQSGAEETFTHEGLMSFDASAVPVGTGTLDLALTLQVAYTTTATRADNPAIMGFAGDANFSFQVPVNPGRIVDVRQSASAAGLAIEIQKVVITPSMTRVELCLSSAEPFAVDAWTAWESPVTLDVNGERVLTGLPSGFTGLNGAPLDPGAACRALAIPDALTRRTGDWSLTLDGFTNHESGQTVSGPWTFTFAVN